MCIRDRNKGGMRMSKPGIHKNKWSKGGGSYWREEAYYLSLIHI